MVAQISKYIPGKTNINYIEDVYKVCLKRYLQNSRINVFESIERGRKILSSGEDVDAYISCYGAHHYYKLEEIFDAINISKFQNKQIETISYGCGAATDTCSLISYCHEKNISLSLDRITLIEPSPIALKRGIEYINGFLSHGKFNIADTKKVNKFIGELEKNDINSTPEAIKLHIFSNVLDIDSIDLESLASLIQQTQVGINYFICVNPKNLKSIIRIDKFHKNLSNLFDISDVYRNDSDITGKKIWMMLQNNYSSTWSIKRYHRIFKTS